MSTAVTIGTPIKLVLAVLLGLCLVVVCVTALANSGAFGASSSTQLVSTGNSFVTELPYIGTILASGMVFVALDIGRRR